METELKQLSVLNELELEAVELFKNYLKDTLKFRTKGTASAAVRARKALSKLAKQSRPIRKKIQEDKKVKVAEKRAKKAGVTSL